ncbi:GNAT family N-acetyltransferase [Maribacter litopenaei]|uniref:GNAT family N-acetyltransferase n=1 Tax=Maribacter litopenaei TaxID=2976127 RepID=A0ABY5YC16_9FLAO|nr:GNAT family N-acetyltransferase [Maribacter litopenaei]UWX56617.1 GNAT family N-acetyltransferase [Maribacter litopenaei]
MEQATLSDTDFFYSLLNSPTWLEYIGDRGIQSKEDAKTYIENSLLTSYREKGFGLWKVSLKDSQIPIGICGFLKRDYLEYPDLGFALLPEYEGAGFVMEACKAVLTYGTSELNFTEVLAVTTKNNTRSRQLLKRLGFAEIGTVQPSDKDIAFLLFSNIDKGN